MLQNILLTGASGYLGGALLARWSAANLPSHGKLFAVVRSEAQADAVRKHGAEPLWLDLSDADGIRRSVAAHSITVVLWFIDAVQADAQLRLIEALAEVGKETGQRTHFIHVETNSRFP